MTPEPRPVWTVWPPRPMGRPKKSSWRTRLNCVMWTTEGSTFFATFLKARLRLLANAMSSRAWAESDLLAVGLGAGWASAIGAHMSIAPRAIGARKRRVMADVVLVVMGCVPFCTSEIDRRMFVRHDGAGARSMQGHRKSIRPRDGIVAK